MSKIKVLQLIKSLGRGGAEMLLPETLALHDNNKFEFHYIYFLPWKNQVVNELEQQGGIVKCFAAANNIKIILSSKKIADYVKQNDIHLIHCHLPWAGITGRLVGKIARVPVIYTEHNKWERYHALTYHLNKLTFKWQQVVIPCSNDVANSIQKHYKKSKPAIHVISNGVNTDKFINSIQYSTDIRQQLSLSKEVRVIGIISVFRTQKRLMDWLAIAQKIHQQHGNTFFIIVGDGPLNKELRQKAEELGMSDYLHFAGLQSEVRPYLKAMDIFMMSSEFEGLPIALLEAMSMECLPACTTAGGIPEVIKDKENGILVNVNQPGELYDRVNELLNNWESTKMMHTAARQTVIDKFSLIQMVQKLETLYLNISK